MGRRGLAGRETWDRLSEDDPASAPISAIQAMEARGATVIVAAADVADESRTAALFEHLRSTLPPLRGIVHAAGVVSTRTSADADLRDLNAAFRPKVAGALVLDKLSRSLPLDFFVCFSSAASVWGAKECSYSAANAALDAFVHERRRLGFPATSINWGPWAGGGMADTAERARAFRVLGLRPLATDRAFRCLDVLMASDVAQATVADADWDTFKAIYSQDGVRPLLDAIKPRSAASNKNGQPVNGELAHWRDEPIEQKAGSCWARLFPRTRGGGARPRPGPARRRTAAQLARARFLDGARAAEQSPDRPGCRSADFGSARWSVDQRPGRPDGRADVGGGGCRPASRSTRAEW